MIPEIYLIEKSFERDLVMAKVHQIFFKFRISEWERSPHLQVGRLGWEATQQRGKVPDSNSEIRWLCRTASPQFQILMHTHKDWVTLTVMENLRLRFSWSGASSALTSRTRVSLIFTLCKSANSPVSLLVTAICWALLSASTVLSIWSHRPCLLWSLP